MVRGVRAAGGSRDGVAGEWKSCCCLSGSLFVLCGRL